MKTLRLLYIIAGLATGLTTSFVNAAQPPFEDLENQEQIEWLRKIVATNRLNLNKRNNLKQTPIFEAAYYNNATLIQRLVDLGAHVNVQDIHNRTPLHEAVYSGNIAAVQALINAKANVNTKDNDERTPLHAAVDIEDVAIIQMLIAAGAHVDVKDENGEAPLFIAIGRGNRTIMKILIDSGANINARNRGKTMLQRAIQSNDVQKAAFLRSFGAIEQSTS